MGTCTPLLTTLPNQLPSDHWYAEVFRPLPALGGSFSLWCRPCLKVVLNWTVVYDRANRAKVPKDTNEHQMTQLTLMLRNLKLDSKAAFGLNFY